MQTISALFTTRPNPVSVAIRMANPVSFCKMGPASHAICVDGDYALEANMLHGVRRVPLQDALDGAVVVAKREFVVPDAQQGLEWMRATAERKAKYDWKGALGLGLVPEREWQEDSEWFCFEYLANGMVKAGRPIFLNNAHVSAYMLLSIIP